MVALYLEILKYGGQVLTPSDCPDSHSGEETPVLIPNTAGKLSSADGTDLETDRESRTLSGHFFGKNKGFPTLGANVL